MGALGKYKVELRTMREDSSHYEYHLDNEFFTDIDAPEIRKGKLDVTLDVRKRADVFELAFHTEGTVLVPCDRCLDDVEIPVVTDDALTVRLGETYSDEDETVVVPEEDGYINVAWFVYEFIALALPVKHVHAPGKCNKDMMGVLNAHLSTDAPDEDDEPYTDGDEEETEGRPTDPRWDELKKILNNNK